MEKGVRRCEQGGRCVPWSEASRSATNLQHHLSLVAPALPVQSNARRRVAPSLAANPFGDLAEATIARSLPLQAPGHADDSSTAGDLEPHPAGQLSVIDRHPSPITTGRSPSLDRRTRHLPAPLSDRNRKGTPSDFRASLSDRDGVWRRSGMPRSPFRATQLPLPRGPAPSGGGSGSVALQHGLHFGERPLPPAAIAGNEEAMAARCAGFSKGLKRLDCDRGASSPPQIPSNVVSRPYKHHMNKNRTQKEQMLSSDQSEIEDKAFTCV